MNGARAWSLPTLARAYAGALAPINLRGRRVCAKHMEEISNCLFQPGDWSTALCDCSDCCSVALACACPCVVMHHISASTASLGAEGTFVACIESAALDCPVVFCIDQFAARCCDWAVAQPYVAERLEMEDHTGVVAAGLKYLVGKRVPTWANDGLGHDLELDDSEDFWPLRMCGSYLCDLWYGMVTCRHCPFGCCCATTPRVPLHISLMLCLLYPVAVCPMAYVLRGAIVRDRKMRETPLHTCLVTTCCLPCAMAQMMTTVENNAGPVGGRTAAPRTVNTMRRARDEDDDFF